jgi:hypothetical protein
MQKTSIIKVGLATLAALAAGVLPMTAAFAQEDQTPTPTPVAEESPTPETTDQDTPEDETTDSVVTIPTELDDDSDDDRIVPGRHRGVVGTLTVDGSAYAVETRSGRTVSFTLASDVIVHQPPLGLADANALANGQRVAVLLQQNEDGSWTAERVLIKPAKPLIQHVTGVVQSIEGNVVIIVDEEGEEYRVEASEGLLARLETGLSVTVVVADLDGDGVLDKTRLSAKGLITGVEIRERLERHAQKIRERVENRTDRIEERVEKQLERIESLLERNHERTKARLQRLIDRAPERTKEDLRRALTNTDRDFEAAKQRAQQARQQVKERIQTFRADLQDQMEQREQEIKDRLEQQRKDAQDRIQQQRQEAKDRIEEKKEEVRDQVQSRVEERREHQHEQATPTPEAAES